METNLSLFSSKPPILTLPTSPNQKPCCYGGITKKPSGSSLFLTPRSKVGVFSLSNPNSAISHNNKRRLNGVELFASTSRTLNNNNNKKMVEETMTTSTSVGVNPQQPSYSYPSSTQIGTPLFWFGVGVAFSALFSFVSQRLKKYATDQAMNMLLGQMNTQNNQFGNPPYSPFPYSPPPSSGPSAPGFPFQAPYGNGQRNSGFPYQPPSPSGTSASTGSASFSAPVPPTSPSYASQAAVGVDYSATQVEAAEQETMKDESGTKPEKKQSAFVDISPEETFEKSPFGEFSGSSSQVISPEVVQNGTAFKEANTSQGGDSTGKRSILSVEALEKMLEDPKVQQMIYPQLPEEMRNPETFKFMMQNPVYRQQLQQMLDNMTGSPEWDSRMLENLRNFDINSPDVKQQFDQLGVTPEEMVSKIMANPEIAMAFQNPRIQQALMDLSQNPWNIAKYQNDQEVMSVFMKLQQLFPGMGGAGGGF